MFLASLRPTGLYSVGGNAFFGKEDHKAAKALTRNKAVFQLL